MVAIRAKMSLVMAAVASLLKGNALLYLGEFNDNSPSLVISMKAGENSYPG